LFQISEGSQVGNLNLYLLTYAKVSSYPALIYRKNPTT
jgi:hypothetical protein